MLDIQGQSSPVLLHLPFTTTGPFIEEDAGTVAHVYWNGTQLVDTKGNAWTMNGTVPQVVPGGPLHPQGFAAPGRAGAGPFNNLNYYSLGPGSDVLDFTGDFSVCVVWFGAGVAARLISDGLYNGAEIPGWDIVTDTAQFAFETDAASTRQILSTLNVPGSGINVGCVGRSGSNSVAKLNLGPFASGAKLYAPNLGVPAIIGTLSTGGASFAFYNTIYEIYATTTTPSDSLFTRIQRHVFQQIGTCGEAITTVQPLITSYEV